MKRSYETINEVLNRYKDEFVDVELYYGDSKTRADLTFHTDYIDWVDDHEFRSIPWDKEIVIDARVMDEESYHHTVEANSALKTDFAEVYGDKMAKVLVIVIDRQRAGKVTNKLEPIGKWWNRGAEDYPIYEIEGRKIVLNDRGWNGERWYDCWELDGSLRRTIAEGITVKPIYAEVENETGGFDIIDYEIAY